MANLVYLFIWRASGSSPQNPTKTGELPKERERDWSLLPKRSCPSLLLLLFNTSIAMFVS